MADNLPAHDIYLTDVSPKDKPWDAHRAAADHVKELYRQVDYSSYANRMQQCSSLLGFILAAGDEGELQFRLRTAHFCRVRHCPVCQGRRSLKWRAKFFQALPKIGEDYPTARWVFLTLTVRNCPLSELRGTLKQMGEAWHRLSRRKGFPALGWVRSVEVTRSPDGTAHPHYHCLMAVPASYFGKGYLKQSEWTELWQQALRVNYTPVVNVKAVKAKFQSAEAPEQQAIYQAICETLKYTVKESDLVFDAQWLRELTEQLHNTRAIATGGILKQYFSDDEPEDLINIDESPDVLVDDEEVKFWFEWAEMIKRYRKK